MTYVPKLTRRAALTGAATLPLAAAAGGASASDTPQGLSGPRVNRVTLGGFELTTLLAGNRAVDDPQGIFGMNVSEETFQEVSRGAFLPTDTAQFFFTPTLLNTGNDLILFDTGLDAEGITAAVAAAGYAPDQVTHVVLTHMHGDHIGGLMQGDRPTFGNAAYITGQAEFDHWSAEDNEGFAKNVAPLADRMSFLSDGDSVASGVTAMAAFGHTPGHMTYMLESDGNGLLLMADLANHYVWSLAHPDWEVRFDMDKQAAAASRRKVLGMLAADRLPVVGYHMPFPAIGFVETRGDGFHYVPHSYQLSI